MNLMQAKEKVIDFLREQGAYALQHQHAVEIAAKTTADFSTNVDDEIEKRFFEFVTNNYPEHGFMGEERPEYDRDGEYKWMIDPIDGTKYFARGIPLWNMVVSLLKDDEPILGLIYNPSNSRLYSAIKGKGAYVQTVSPIGYMTPLPQEQTKLRIQSAEKTGKLIDNQISLDIPVKPAFYKENKNKLSELQSSLTQNCYRVRNIGCGPLSLAWMTQGVFVAYIDLYRPPRKYVDVAPGLLIATEAGCVSESWLMDSEQDWQATVTCHPQFMDELVIMVKKLLN